MLLYFIKLVLWLCAQDMCVSLTMRRRRRLLIHRHLNDVILSSHIVLLLMAQLRCGIVLRLQHRWTQGLQFRRPGQLKVLPILRLTFVAVRRYHCILFLKLNG